MLNADKLEYKRFGVYWWAVKEALRTYVHNGKWYCGDIEDTLMKERAWHGDLFRTMLAGMCYMNQQIECTSGHTWTDKDGNEHDYTLFDEQAGC